MNDFGLYLKKLRGKRSLRDLSKATGISHTYLSTLEKGFDPRSKKPRKPTAETINKLASALEVDSFEMLEKAGLLDNKTSSILNEVKNMLKMEWRPATKDEIEDISKLQKEKAIDLEELFDPTSSNLLKYKGQLLNSQDKQKILKSMAVLFDE